MQVEGPGFFHKAPLYLWTFQFAKAWLSWPLLMQIRIADQLRRLSSQLPCRYCTRSDEKACHPSLGRGALTDGICAASLSPEAKRKARLAGKIISPPKSILLTFFRLSR